MKIYKIESNGFTTVSDGSYDLQMYSDKLEIWFTKERFPNLPRSLQDPENPVEQLYSSITYFQPNDTLGSFGSHAIKIKMDGTVVPMTKPEIASILEAIWFGSDVYSIVKTDFVDNLRILDASTQVNTEEYYATVSPPPGSSPTQLGVIFTGRGSGLGPLDMNVSYFTEWNAASVDEDDTELYAPATGTVMPYGNGGEGKFDSFGNVFTEGNYTIQVRQASTGTVLAEYECPLAPSGENVKF